LCVVATEAISSSYFNTSNFNTISRVQTIHDLFLNVVLFSINQGFNNVFTCYFNIWERLLAAFFRPIFALRLHAQQRGSVRGLCDTKRSHLRYKKITKNAIQKDHKKIPFAKFVLK